MAEHESVPVSSIPLVVALWEQSNFGGRKRTFIEAPLDPILQPSLFPDLADLGNCNFSGVTNAIGIHAGPNFIPGEQRTVSFFENPNYQGDEICLAPGAYGSLAPFDNFGGKISSIRFNAPAPNNRVPGYYQGGTTFLHSYLDPMNPAARIFPIPLVVKLFVNPLSNLDPKSGYPIGAQDDLNYLTLVEDALNIGAMFGADYNQKTSAVVVQKGPDYNISAYARLVAGVLAPGDSGAGVSHLDVRPDQDTEPTAGLIGVAYGVYPALEYPPYNFDALTQAVKIVVSHERVQPGIRHIG